ncbi:MAG TPA: alkaline phosphatase family protein [Candidatus Binatia bacterium]|jgi:predicted AlkP superfamily phosphohydrolase/phosphomutase
MIAVLQFDGVSLPHLHKFLKQGYLPALAQLRGRGHWFSLGTPAASWEAATYYSLYSGKGITEHGIYFAFMWAPTEQRVRSSEAYPAPEPIWDRIGKLGRRSLVIDPYESGKPRSVEGVAMSGWQFRHKVTLRKWSVPEGLDRELERRFGRPSLVEEVYGRPSAPYLLKMRRRLLGAPERAANVTTALLSEGSFDLIWVTFSSSHIAGHWFLDPSRLPGAGFNAKTKTDLDATLGHAYAAVDEALSRILAALPAHTDIIVLSASGIGPTASRSHLLPGMLQAVLSANAQEAGSTEPAGNFLWRLRKFVPPNFRAQVARVLPAPLVMEVTARLAMRGVDWSKTKAFMLPSADCGYVRLNLMGRERDGIVDPKEAPRLMERIAAGLHTFSDPDGSPAVKTIEFTSNSLGYDTFSHPFPDLVVHWSERLPPQPAVVHSPIFGPVASAGWGSGRTGEHCDDAWALIVPGSSRLRNPVNSPHIMDIAPTICSVLRVDSDGLTGQSLLEPGA